MKKTSIILMNLILVLGIFITHLYLLKRISDNVYWVSGGEIIADFPYPYFSMNKKGIGGGFILGFSIFDISILAFLIAIGLNLILLMKEK